MDNELSFKDYLSTVFKEVHGKIRVFNTTLKLLLAEVSQILSEIKEGETPKESWKVLPLNATRQYSV